MKKYLLTLVLTILCVFAFVITISAETYTVSSNEAYKESYANAVNGDTIVIDQKLTCDIYANKSITYVLKADWESSKLVVDQSNVEVSFIADGGNYKILPTNYSTTEGWLHLSQAYDNVVINLGGKNGGTLTIDGSNATHDRVTYVEGAAITLNLLNGSAIANFNTTTKDNNENACILYARTVNMYDGSKIYGNRVISAPLIKSNNFNLFGGEIFGNLLTSTRTNVNGVGFIYAYNQFTMYGGNISDNIFNATGGTSGVINAVGFISARYGIDGAKMVVYGGELGNAYVSGNGQAEISAMFGVNTIEAATSYFYYNTAVKGTRYKFTDTPTLVYNESIDKNIWTVNNYTVLSSNWNGWCHKQTKVWGTKATAFINAQKKSIAGTNFDNYEVINAYIYGGSGNDAYGIAAGNYAHSGSTTVAIPNGYNLWSTSNGKYCHTGKAYTLDEIKSANDIVYYTAYEAERVTNDGMTSCSGCGMVYLCNNAEHTHITLSLDYESFEKEGKKVVECTVCNVVNTFSVPPLFTCLGYSAIENGDVGFTIGYSANNEAIKEFEEANKSTVNYGVFAVLKDNIKDLPIFSDDGTPAYGVISADITDYGFSLFNLKIIGFSEENKSAKLAVGAYVATVKDNETEYAYLQSGTVNENEKYHFASYNDIIAKISN